MYKKILIPLDGSILAEQALEPAIVLAGKFSSEVHLVQVITNYLVPSYGIDYQVGETFRDVSLREANAYLQNVKDRLEVHFDGDIKFKVIEGLVAENIVDYAESQQIDVIVMATHGRSGIGRWVFGSVAERVLRAANCPVLMIRASEKDVNLIQEAEEEKFVT